MKLSKFNLWVQDHPKAGDYLLFNTRTQALIKVSQSFKKGLEDISRQTPLDLSPEISKSIPALKENGVLVEDDAEEESKLKDFFRQLKYESNQLPFEVTILTTYSCNFACVYCFEERVKESVFLDKETSTLIVEWLTNRIAQRGHRKVFLVFYGGEPLLNISPIYDISWHVNEWAKMSGVEFGFGLITNGSLVKPDLIEKFLTVGLKDIRVSIDGDREHHDRKRPFIDGRPSFDLIINNIKSVIDKVNVGIAGNFDRENAESIIALLDFLEKEELLYKLSNINFAPLVPRLGPKDSPQSIELRECLSYVGGNGLFSELIKIKRELLRRRVKFNTGLAINACSLIMQDAGLTIDPRGLIYKCNALVGYPEFSVGDVRYQELNEKQEEFLDSDAWNKCEPTCPYVPMCQGGCRFFSYLENQNFTGLSCKKEYFQKACPELIKLEYDKLAAQ